MSPYFSSKIFAGVADFLAIIASIIAIYIFVAKRHIISSVLRVLVNFSSQITLVEIKANLERLNDYDANDAEQIENVINILSDILGQIRGNKLLSKHLDEVIPKIIAIAEDRRRLTEPRKRSLVSELRERLRNIDVAKYADMIGE